MKKSLAALDWNENIDKNSKPHKTRIYNFRKTIKNTVLTHYATNTNKRKRNTAGFLIIGQACSKNRNWKFLFNNLPKK